MSTATLRTATASTTLTAAIAADRYFSIMLTGSGETLARIQFKGAGEGGGGASTNRGFALRSSDTS